MSVAPYIVRPNDREIQDMMRAYEIDNVELLVQHMEEWFGCDEAAIDEQGLYGISTKNPQGMWGYWVIRSWIYYVIDKKFIFVDQDVFPVTEFIEIIDIDKDPELSPMIVVEPDGKWHDQEGVDPVWQKEILNNYPDHLVVLCDLN
jgi:hypothetical protein